MCSENSSKSDSAFAGDLERSYQLMDVTVVSLLNAAVDFDDMFQTDSGFDSGAAMHSRLRLRDFERIRAAWLWRFGGLRDSGKEEVHSAAANERFTDEFGSDALFLEYFYVACRSWHPRLAARVLHFANTELSHVFGGEFQLLEALANGFDALMDELQLAQTNCCAEFVTFATENYNGKEAIGSDKKRLSDLKCYCERVDSETLSAAIQELYQKGFFADENMAARLFEDVLLALSQTANIEAMQSALKWFTALELSHCSEQTEGALFEKLCANAFAYLSVECGYESKATTETMLVLWETVCLPPVDAATGHFSFQSVFDIAADNSHSLQSADTDLYYLSISLNTVTKVTVIFVSNNDVASLYRMSLVLCLHAYVCRPKARAHFEPVLSALRRVDYESLLAAETMQKVHSTLLDACPPEIRRSLRQHGDVFELTSVI